MAITGTSIAVAFTKTQNVLTATSATGATVGGFARVNDEFMFITSINGAAIEVRSRGSYGGIAKDHDILSPLTFGLVSDLSDLGTLETLPVPTMTENLLTIGQNGAIAVPTRNTTYLITKGSALASSAVPDPSKSQDGLRLTFVSGSDFAHVVTFTNAFDGTTGASTTFTMAAFKGASFTVIASKGLWLTLSNCLTTIT